MNKHEIQTYHLIIRGKVQSVGFRHWFSNLAIMLSLKGYVKNLKNTREVEAIIQGEIKNIKIISKKCIFGPKFSKVERVISSQIFTKVIYFDFKIKKNIN